MLFLLNLPLDSPPTSQSTLLNLALTSEASLVLVVSVAFSVELLVLEVSYLVVDAWVPAVSELDSTALVLVTLIFSLVVVVCTQLDGLPCHPLSEGLTIPLTLRYLGSPIAIDLVPEHPALAVLLSIVFVHSGSNCLLFPDLSHGTMVLDSFLYVCLQKHSASNLALGYDHHSDSRRWGICDSHHALDGGHHHVLDGLVHRRGFVACLCHHHPWF